MRKTIFSLLALLVAGLVVSVASAEEEKPVLRVLSYNINGLPPALVKGKAPHFERIAEILRERRTEGTQPHIVVLQEAFDKRSAIIADTTGYAYVFKGPGRRDTVKTGNVHWTPETRKSYAQRPIPQKIAGSGLYILSDFPLMDARYRAFDSESCAGFDCLSNKAIQFVRVQTPFASDPIDIVNSHFNSRSSAKAPGKIVLRAHKRQTDLLANLLDQFQKGYPVVVAGDFNTKQDKRYSYFREHIPLFDAGEVCIEGALPCALAAGTKQEEILYVTNDKQFYGNGKTVSLEPIWMARNFDEMLGDKPLSDHLGYEVHYRVNAND